MAVHACVESNIHFGDLLGSLVFVQVLTVHIKTLPRLVARRLRLDEASCHFLLLLSVALVEDSHWFVGF